MTDGRPEKRKTTTISIVISSGFLSRVVHIVIMIIIILFLLVITTAVLVFPRAPILPNEHSRTTSSRAPVCSLGIVIGVRVRIARNCNYYHILEITRRANVYFGGSNARARHIINGVDSVHVKTGERSETRVHTRTDFIQSRRGKETTTASRPELFESCLCVISSTYESY